MWKNISTQQTIGLLVEMSNVLLPLQLFWHLDPTCTENTDIVIVNRMSNPQKYSYNVTKSKKHFYLVYL